MTVANEVKRIQLPQAIAAYNAGSSVSFGSLTVSQLGIALSQKGLPWHQFAGIQINKGYVDIFKKGGLLKWMHVRTQKVPNLFVLLSLIDYARSSKQ